MLISRYTRIERNATLASNWTRKSNSMFEAGALVANLADVDADAAVDF